MTDSLREAEARGPQSVITVICFKRNHCKHSRKKFHTFALPAPYLDGVNVSPQKSVRKRKRDVKSIFFTKSFLHAPLTCTPPSCLYMYLSLQYWYITLLYNHNYTVAFTFILLEVQ